MAKNPKGRGGTSSLRLTPVSAKPTLPGAKPPKPEAPKPVRLTAGQ